MIKKLFLLAALSFVAVSYVSAQYYFDFGYSEDSVVNVSATATDYVIDFELNMDSLHEVIHSTPLGNFSTLDLPKSYFFDYKDSVGRPMLPIRQINLEIPEDFDMVVAFSTISFTYEYIDLERPYLPCQHIYVDSLNTFEYHAPSYAHSPDWTLDNTITISPFFHFFNEKGLRVDIYPYSYDPIHNQVRVIRKMQAKIPLVGSQPGNYHDLTTLHIFDWNQYLKELRDTIGHGTVVRERILIITPEEYLDELAPYVSYRQHQHFYVTTITLEQIATNQNMAVNELTAIHILAAIHAQYLISSPQPAYVILVGDPTVIPYSGGIPGDVSDPATDYYYALPQTSPTSLTMLLAVGRWPVERNHGEQVDALVKNSVEFEEYVAGFAHKSDIPIDLVSGSGDWGWLMYSDLRSTYRIVKSTYNAKIYDGRDYDNCDLYPLIKTDLVNDLWMLIYSGHGNEDGLSYPLCFNNLSIVNLYQMLRPMVFAFACKTNKSDFGKKWLLHNLKYSDSLHCYNSDYGCVSYFGSTTNTNCTRDRSYMNTIFRNFNYLRLGKALVAGAQKYYYSSRENQIKRYVFLGDPVLCYHGYPRSTPLEVSKRDEDSLNDNDNVAINHQNGELEILFKDFTSAVKIFVYDIVGKLYFNDICDKNTTIDMRTWPYGIYIVEIISDEKETKCKILNIK